MTARFASPRWQGALRCLFPLLAVTHLILTVGAVQAQAIQFGNYHALVIGNNDYEHWTPLKTAVRDAEDVAGILEDKYGFEVELLINATYNDIIRAINQLRYQLTEDDNLLIYYAGHGQRDGEAGFWIGVDGEKGSEIGWVDVSSRITRNLKAMNARHVLVVADSCYSGTLTRADDDAGLRTGQKRSTWLKRMTEKRARIALVSGGLEPVADAGRDGHSAFAIEFLEALDENDDVLEGQELFSRIKADVVVNADQTPDYGKIRLADDNGGDFLFVPRGVEVAALGAPTDKPNFGPQQRGDGGDVFMWQAIQSSTVPADFETFLKTYPNSTLKPLAHRRLAMLGVRQAPETTPSPADPAVGVFPEALGSGEVFRDCPDCPEMVVVPTGSVMMGSTEAERQWAVEQGAQQEWVDWEKPQHRVAITELFAVGKYEVFRGQFAQFVQKTGHDVSDGCWEFIDNEWKQNPSNGWRSPGFEQTDRDPVVCVGWEDAQAYVAWLSQETDQPYRLLSEAEWEYATRAGTTTRYSWGDDTPTSKQANFARNIGKTAEIGTYPPNPWGLYDMHGNVWEWVEDCWNESYEGAPTDGSAWTSGDCSRRVLRGGSWISNPRGLRSAIRIRSYADFRVIYAGFRVARTLR